METSRERNIRCAKDIFGSDDSIEGIRDGIKRARDRGLTDASIRNYLAVLSGEWLVAHPDRAQSPYTIARKYERLANIRTPTPAIPEHCIRKILDEAKELGTLGTLVAIGLSTGLRLNDLIAIRGSHIRNGVLTYTERKSNTVRKIKLPDWVISEYTIPSLSPLWDRSARAFHIHIKMLFDACGAEGCTTHSMRVTAISRAFEMGATLPQVMRMSGHKSEAQCLSYRRNLKEDSASEFINY